MRLTVLSDNNTFIDRYLQGEPGLAYLIEADDKRILFDVGYSDLFLRNAHKLGISLFDLDFVVLSHGHFDHTWGMFALIQHFTERIIEEQAVMRPRLIAHPSVLSSRTYRKIPEIGSLLTGEKLSSFFHLQFTREPRRLTERLLFLGEIEKTTDFEAQKPVGRIVEGDQLTDDPVLDDTALVYRSPKGLVVITGCSHSGICNMVEYAKKVCGDERIIDIIGGFHLLDPSPKQLEGTIQYLTAVNPDMVHACHCTDLMSKIALSRSLNLKEVGVGLRLEY
jgi:7,8-dihydropterin-6-yl-methyl-4-(beta-D-ribofuranosyl)aminobenzene 5'-phosphate synthase